MDMTMDPNKKVRMPRTRICYICGRQYGLTSYDIHLKQCKKLWIDRESKKPKHERKPLPRDPMEAGGVDGIAAGSGQNMGATSRGGGGEGMTGEELQRLNNAAQDSYNNAALSACAYCGRTFLPEKLVIHNKSCTAEKPAKRIGQSRLSEKSAPMKPNSTMPASSNGVGGGKSAPWKKKPRNMAKTTGGMKQAATMDGFDASQQLQDSTAEFRDSTSSLDDSGRPIAGNYGGAGSRGLRKSISSAADSSDIAKTLENLDARLLTVEDNVTTIMQDMSDLKTLLKTIHLEISQK